MVGLTVLVGAPTAGKSTFAAANFAPPEIVSADQCSHLLGGCWWEAQQLFHWLIDTRARLGLTTVSDATNLLPCERSRLLEIASHYGIPATAVLLNVSVDRALARNAKRSCPIPEMELLACVRKFGTALEAIGGEAWAEFTVLNT